MPRIDLRRTVPAPADRVWEVVADFGNVHRVHPHVVASRSTSGPATGVGATRRCEFDAEGRRWVDEQVEAFDPAARRMRVAMLEGTFRPPVRDLVATITVTPSGDDHSIVDLRMDMDGTLLQRALAATVVRAKFTPALEALLAGIEHHVVTGQDVTDATSLDRVASTG